jgi:O-antigen ligase
VFPRGPGQAEVTALAAAVRARVSQHAAARSDAVILLQLFAVTLMVFPSDSVLKAVGGGGYVAGLVAYCLFFLWIAASFLGLHNPLDYKSPVRMALCVMWIVSLVSYLLMDRTLLSGTQQTGANRWLLQLAGVSGVILVASEGLRSLADIRRVLRALAWGGAFCGLVATLQYRMHIDLDPDLRRLPGFSMNAAQSAYGETISRGAVSRVIGTAIDPIELGVTAGMILPLAVYIAMHDVQRPRWQRWLPVIFILLSVAASGSRSSVLAAGLSIGVLLIALPAASRLTGVAGIVVATAAVFAAAHGLIGTLTSYFLAGTSDNSIAHRVNNYPYVEQLVRQAPWFGTGGGTYITVNSLHIFDNEYLTTAVQLGLVGMVALAFFLIWPAAAVLVARARSVDPEIRDLCAALAGAELAAVVCSGTFDSLSFPMFVGVQALVAGLTGAVWRLTGAGEPVTAVIQRQLSGVPDRYRRAGRPAVEHAGGTSWT